MTTTEIPPNQPTQANGNFTDEQRRYLEGFLAALQSRGFGPAARFASVPASSPSTSETANLIFEERVKQELHPLDSYALLLEHAAANQAPERENAFRFKWHGLFHLAPNAAGFMARLRIPGGQLTTYQFREVARLAQERASGFADITSRANLQLRVIQPKDAPEVLRRIQQAGLHGRGSGADNIRNLTASPTAGLDPHELIDVSPLVHQLAQIIIHDRELYNLPRKFNIAFDGGGLIGVMEDTNDIGLKAVSIRETVPSASGSIRITPGVYFRVKLGGITGHQTFASDLGVLLRPEETAEVVLALVRVYIANGNRADRKKARLKYLLASWGFEKYLLETEKKLGRELLRLPLDASGNCPGADRRPLPDRAHPHIGAYPQKQTGLNYVGVDIPAGRMLTRQMLRLAEMADLYGSGDLRLTAFQNLIIPNVPDAFVETVRKAVRKTGFTCEVSNLRGGLIACTGNAYCKYSSTDTKGHAIELARYLEKRLALDVPINIHITGCPNSCAQHYIGDIGLLGAKVKVAGETMEGYHVFVGGGFGEHQALGRQIFHGVSVAALKPTLERMLKTYLQLRQNNESFQAFTRRHDLNQLQTLFSE